MSSVAYTTRATPGEPPATKLTVISGDLNVVNLCKEVLRELGEDEWSCRIQPPDQSVPSSDVYLWDFDGGQTPLWEAKSGETILYLISAAQLENFRAAVPGTEGNILLKPLTRAVLKAFLSSVVRGPDKIDSPRSNGDTIGSLRADRDEILRCLLHANLRLQEYDQQRTNFIARAVHEFRAPLTALSGFCGLLASSELGPLNETQKEALRRMQHSAKRISSMAASMFDLSTASQISPKLDLREGNVQECIKQAVYEILPLAREKRISLQAESVMAPAGRLCFEPSQIEQVLINLLDNACKFTPTGGSIDVIAYPYFWERRFLQGGRVAAERRSNPVRSPNAYRVDIKDTGAGVPPDHLERIFEEYTSYGGAQDRSGGGLGLAICRLIVSRHKGRIWVDSNQNGSTFSFVLPHTGDSKEGERRE